MGPLIRSIVLCAAAAGIAWGTPSESPQYVSRVWRTQDGLPENRIRALAQTPDGYLWVGTSGGLARFDGVRFVVYSRLTVPQMADENIRTLSVARDGSLWIATDGGGLLHLQDGRFRAFGPRDGLANEFVNAALEAHDDSIWAATNRGLFRRSGERFERVDQDLHLANIAFFGLIELRDGTVLAGGPAGLFRFEGGKLRAVEGQGEDMIYMIREASDGSLWMSTNHGLRTIGVSRRNTRRPNTRGMIGAIGEDHLGNLWFGTLGDGLYRVCDGEETTLRTPVLPNNGVSALLEDREQNLWVGTSDGLVRLSTPVISVLKGRDGLSDDNISTIYADRPGTLWLTTVTGKIVKYAEGRASEFRLPPPARELRVRGTLEDRSGALWFGTDNAGVVRFANGKATRFTTADGLRNNGFQAFYEDRQGRLWIGTTSGISRWDGAHFQNYYLEDGLSYGWIRTMVEDRNGDILVGTDRGLNRIHGDRIIPEPAFAALSHDRVWSIYPGNDGSLWVATRGAGLVRVRDSKVARITTNEGLLSNSIFQLMGDGAGKLWMSGPKGLSAASLSDLNAVADGTLPSIAVITYGTGDGLESAQINGGVQPAGAVAADGQLWFPSVQGAIHLRPDHPKFDYHPPVRIESVIVDDQPGPAKGEVVIGPGRHRVEIEFTACTLRAPERIAFRYRLSGYDPQWIPATARRSANYYNLSPGKYRFEVIARDGSIEGGTSQTAFSLVIQPHFYQTAWFYVLAVGLAGICVIGVIRFQAKQARERYNLRLGERTRIAREMHDTVVQGCVGVSTLIEAAVGSARSDHDLMLECLDNARVHLRLTLDEARQALVDLRHDTFEHGLRGALCELGRSVNNEKTVPVTVEVAGAPIDLPDSTNRTLLLVAREAIRNALAHASPSAVAVTLSFQQEAVRLEVRDDGHGFVPSMVHLAAAGHFGILGMRERMEQILGTLEIVSEPGAGTLVTARLLHPTPQTHCF
jgi:ligand-binding sensor domain-containing protein/signal transduction histidine kinase